MDVLQALAEYNEANETETVPVQRGVLRALLTRLYVAEGMRVEAAKYHADAALAGHEAMMARSASSPPLGAIEG